MSFIWSPHPTLTLLMTSPGDSSGLLSPSTAAAAPYTLSKQVFSTETRSSAVRDGGNLLQTVKETLKLKLIGHDA